MRNSPFFLILIGTMILLDFYVFQGIKVIAQPAGSRAKSIIYITYWTLSILALLTFVLLPYINAESFPRSVRNVIFAIIVALFFSKLIVAIFLLVDDIRRGIQWAAGKLFFSNTEGEMIQESDKISRSVFLSWVGMAAGGGLLGSLIYGFSNKYNYDVRKVSMKFNNLPESFRGMKVVQISDIHCGSFGNRDAVMMGVEKIMKLNPDLIVFTGDLVNNKAEEMDGYVDVFKQLQAPFGIYSILGNHDYGDYVEWESQQHKIDNLQALKEVHAAMGWKLLLNENAHIEKNGDKIAILGVENWSSKARFPKYGKLSQAYTGTESAAFKILLSHDPSHWEGEVLTNYKDIDMVLSGHTHGMQFGVEVPWLKWSPVQYVYKHWAGLYENGNQKLYVNRGFGFIGYPGRVGILPEITLIHLS